MKTGNILVPALLVVAACSETPVEEQGEEAIAEREIEIEEDARSLEEAADEAVRALEEDIDAELAAEGIGGPEPMQLPDSSEN